MIEFGIQSYQKKKLSVQWPKIYQPLQHLTKAETGALIESLMKEVDNDEDGAICFPEFQQAMQKCPDFQTNFKMYI